MHSVADYRVIADHSKSEKDQEPDGLKFPLPDNLDVGERVVLSFILRVSHDDDIAITFTMNGHKALPKWSAPGDDHFLGFYQESLPPGVCQPGSDNRFRFDSSSGAPRSVELSDIVLWFKKNI